MIDVDEVESRLAALQSAVADLVDLPWCDVPIDGAGAVVAGVESAQRTLSMVGYAAVDRLRRDQPPGLGRRFRDYLANGLHISASDAAARIATAADLAGDRPDLPETAAASRYGLIGPEHVRIIRDTVAKLPYNADESDRARFDLELAGVAVAERPEVLRREAALLLAEYDAIRDDPVTRESSRAARREFILGPQDADGMSRGRFCLDPEARAYMEIVFAKLARPGMCNAADPMPAVDGEPDLFAAAGDPRTTAQRNHDAVKAAMRALLGVRRSRQASRTAGHRNRDDDTAGQLESASGLALTGGGSTCRWKSPSGWPPMPSLPLHLRREMRPTTLSRPQPTTRFGRSTNCAARHRRRMHGARLRPVRPTTARCTI